MKNIVFILSIVFTLSAVMIAGEAVAKPGKPAGKHKSHKKAKKKKSKYMFNFQN